MFVFGNISKTVNFLGSPMKNVVLWAHFENIRNCSRIDLFSLCSLGILSSCTTIYSKFHYWPIFAFFENLSYGTELVYYVAKLMRRSITSFFWEIWLLGQKDRIMASPFRVLVGCKRVIDYAVKVCVYSILHLKEIWPFIMVFVTSSMPDHAYYGVMYVVKSLIFPPS